MLDTLLTKLKEEVAIDGPSGTCINDLWNYVHNISNTIASESKITKINPTIDENYKSFLWNYIKIDDNVNFFQLDDSITVTPAPEDNSTATQKQKRKAPMKKSPKKKAKKANKKKKKNDDDSAFEESEEESQDETEDEDEIKQSESDDAEEFERQQNLNLIKNARDMSYNDVLEYGLSFYLVATTKLQEEQLYLGVPPGVSLSANMLVILKRVLRSRHVGIYQSEISKLFDVDARSAGHYCKSLEDKGCIVRNGVSVQCTHTNICMHVRFASQDKSVDMSNADIQKNRVFYNVNVNNESFSQTKLRDAMVDLVKDAPGQRILGKDVLEALGFTESKEVKSWFNRSLDELCIKGFFKKSNVKLENKGRYFRCIHLLKLPEEKENDPAKTQASLEEITYPIRIKSTRNEIPIIHMLHDSPIKTQFYQLVETAGEQGVVSREIMYALNMNEQRMLYKLLEEVIEVKKLNNGYYGIERHMEFEGRVRRYRYFTTTFYNQIMGITDNDIGPLPEMPYDDSDCTEVDPRKKAPHGLKDYTNYILKLCGKNAGGKVKKTPTTSKLTAEKKQTVGRNAAPKSKLVAISKETPQVNQKPEMMELEALQSSQTSEMMEVEAPQLSQTSKTIEIETSQKNMDTNVLPVKKTKVAQKKGASKNTQQKGIMDFFSASKKRTSEEASTASVTKKSKRQTEDDSDENMTDSTGELSPVVLISKSPILKNNILTTDTSKTNVDTSPNLVETAIVKNAQTPKKAKPIATVKNTKISESSEATVSETDNDTLKKYIHSKKPVNSYMGQRINILREYLSKTPIFEIDKHFRGEYQKRLTEVYGGGCNGVICMKTIRRSIKVLEDRNEAVYQTVPCTTYNGHVFNRYIIMDKSIAKDGPEHKAFLDDMINRYSVHRVFTKPSKYESISIPVERLVDRLERMRNSLEELDEQGETAKATALRRQIDQLSKNYEQCRTADVKTPKNNWLISAVQYGYSAARMVRARKIHEYIISLLNEPEQIDGVDKEKRTLTLSSIVSNLPIHIMCEAMGVIHPNDKLKKYLRSKENMSVTLSKAPPDIRMLLCERGSSFRHKLYSSMIVLEYLCLVKPQGTAQENSTARPETAFASRYLVHQHVTIRDRRIKGDPIIRDFSIQSNGDVADYWAELDHIYKGPLNISESELASKPKNKYGEVFKAMSKTTSWVEPSIYSKPQRRILNSYIDKTTYTTPVDNERLIQEIALDIDCTPLTVREYYKKVQDSFYREEESRKNKKLSASILRMKKRHGKSRVNMLDGRRVLRLDTKDPFNYEKPGPKMINPHAKASGPKEPESAENKALFMDDLSNLPYVKNEMDISIARKRLTRASSWTKKEDDVFMLSTAILRYRAKSTRFRWTALTQVFDKSTKEFQRRYSNMVKSFGFSERLNEHVDKWERIYKRAIVNGDIEDPNPYDMANFDLLGQLSYFIQKLAENDSNDMALLPKNLNEIDKHFDISYSDQGAFAYYEDDYHKYKTMSAKLKSLGGLSFCTRACRISEMDDNPAYLNKDNNSEERQIAKYRSIVLAGLLTPSEIYDPYYVYMILKDFPKEIGDKSIERMIQSSLLIRKPNQDRTVPGTRNALSYRFASTMGSTLPTTLFTQAKEYHKFLSTQTEMTPLVGEFVSSGMMACILDLVSQGKLCIDLEDRDKVLSKAMEPIQRVRMISADAQSFDIVHGKSGELTTQASLTCDSVMVEKLTVDAFDSAFDTLLKQTDKSLHPLLKDTVDFLEQKMEEGSVLFELKKKLGARYTDRNLYDGISILKDHSPPLVYVVGFSTVRYVLSPFVSEWAIDIEAKDFNDLSKNSNEMNTLSLSESIQTYDRTSLALPSLWHDLNGNSTHQLLKGFCRTVIDLVIRLPGIVVSSMLRQVHNYLTRKELYEILDILVKQGVLRTKKIVIHNYKKPSVFSKTRTARCTNDPYTINIHAQSCYWINEEYYNYL